VSKIFIADSPQAFFRAPIKFVRIGIFRTNLNQSYDLKKIFAKNAIFCSNRINLLVFAKKSITFVFSRKTQIIWQKIDKNRRKLG
jgi:hypothetical protein